MNSVRRIILAAALSVGALGATGLASAAHATTPTPSIQVPPVAQPQADHGVCVGDAAVWFLNFCEL